MNGYFTHALVLDGDKVIALCTCAMDAKALLHQRADTVAEAKEYGYSIRELSEGIRVIVDD